MNENPPPVIYSVHELLNLKYSSMEKSCEHVFKCESFYIDTRTVDEKIGRGYRSTIPGVVATKQESS